MVGRRHPPEEIAAKLVQADEMAAKGKSQREITRALGVSVMTYHRWRKDRADPTARAMGEVGANLVAQGEGEFSRRAIPVSNRVHELELENTRLRRLVTDLLLEKVKLEEQIYQRRGASRSRRF